MNDVKYVVMNIICFLMMSCSQVLFGAMDSDEITRDEIKRECYRSCLKEFVHSNLYVLAFMKYKEDMSERGLLLQRKSYEALQYENKLENEKKFMIAGIHALQKMSPRAADAVVRELIEFPFVHDPSDTYLGLNAEARQSFQEHLEQQALKFKEIKVKLDEKIHADLPIHFDYQRSTQRKPRWTE